MDVEKRGEESSIGESVDAADEGASTYRFARLATAMLCSPQPRDDALDLAASLVGALRGDSRVLEVQAPELNVHFTSWEPFFPYVSNSTRPHELLTGADRLFAFRMSTPIVFTVRVPIKNQPLHHESDDIPTDTYAAAWDGTSLFVAWDQQGELLPISAGHVVLDVVEATAHAVALDLYRQACGPGCEFGFLHTSLEIEVDSSAEQGHELSIVALPDTRSAMAIVPHAMDLQDAVEYLWFALSQAAAAFAEMKNQGQRLLDIEEAARIDVSRMLALNYEHARIGVEPIRRRWRSRWRNRGWRGDAREVISGLWLSVTNMEALERAWQDSHRSVYGDFESLVPLFQRDSRADIRRINTLDPGTIVEAVEQASSNLNHHQIALVTVAGGLGGALAGGVVTAAAAAMGGG